MGYPIISTWCKSIDTGYVKGCPILILTRVRHPIKVTTDTEIGHIYQQRQGTCYTEQPTNTKTYESITPVPQTKSNDKKHHVNMISTNISGKLYSDETGRFSVTSSPGNYYVVIFYTVYGNHIKEYPINS